MADYYTANGTPVEDYDLEKRFNGYLDDLYGDAQVAGHHFQASRTLRAIDPVQWQADFDKWIYFLLNIGMLFEDPPEDDDCEECAE